MIFLVSTSIRSSGVRTPCWRSSAESGFSGHDKSLAGRANNVVSTTADLADNAFVALSETSTTRRHACPGGSLASKLIM